MFKVDLEDAILAGLLERGSFDAAAGFSDDILEDHSRRRIIRLRDLVLAFILPSRGNVMLKVLLTHIDEDRCKDVCGQTEKSNHEVHYGRLQSVSNLLCVS